MFEMKANAWIILRLLWGSNRKLGTPWYIPEQGSISLSRADELSSRLCWPLPANSSLCLVCAGCSPSFVPRSVVQPSLGPGRRRALWVSIGSWFWFFYWGSQGDTQRRWDRRRRDRLLSPSHVVVWRGLPPPFPLGLCQRPPHGPKGFSNTGLPAAIAGLGWSSLPLLLAPG